MIFYGKKWRSIRSRFVPPKRSMNRSAIIMEVNTIALRTAEEIYESVRDQYLRGSIDWVSLQQNRSNLDNAILIFHQTRADAVRTYYQIRSLVLYDFERNEPLIYHEK